MRNEKKMVRKRADGENVKTDARGFEPRTSSLEGWRPIQARPRAHRIANFPSFLKVLS